MITDLRIRLFLIESQLLFARALSQVLSTDAGIKITGVLRSLDELAGSPPDGVDLVLVDIDEYATDVAAAFALCRRAAAGARTCALSSFARPELMQRCLAAGADGFVIKDTSIAELTSAIKLLAAGTPYVDGRVAGGALRRRAGGLEMHVNDLTTREADIVRLIARGLSNRDIGAELLLSEKTIKNHVSRIFEKLQIPARTGVAVYAVRSGLA